MGVKTNLAAVGSKITSYSLTAAVPSLNPADLEGETGSVKFDTQPMPFPQVLRNSRYILTDDKFGSLAARISEINWSEGGASFSSETMLQRLNIDGKVLPQYLVSMATAMDNVLALAGMNSAGLPTSGTVTFPGWKGTLLDYIKHFCVVYGYEYYSDSATPDTVKFRAVRSSTFSGNYTGISYTVNDQSIAQNVDVAQYAYTVPATTTDFIEFAPVSVDDPQILTVNAGETVEYDIQCNGWLSAVNQPVAMDLVGPTERTDSGAYCVAGNDGLPVTAAQWVSLGGKVVVSIGDDPSTIHVAVTAPPVSSILGTSGEDTFSPYSIAATAVDDNTFYNSLHITGKGVRYAKTVQRFPTGAVSTATMEEVGATVENPFVSTPSQLWAVGVAAAQAYAGPNFTVEASLIPNVDYTQVLGSRLEGGGGVFRVQSVTASPEGVSFSGSSDTLFSEFNTKWAGKTFGDFNTERAGQTFSDFAVTSAVKA